MSKAASSPTARLLQHSRLFSLPRPLPQPTLETITSTGIYRASDTATVPYPTHQAIATPPSSHFRGDWGLKRPLPAKATRGTSTPHIKVSAQDTPEHITDFGSAADHTRTQAKWQEMGVPLMVRQARGRHGSRPPVSVFEEALDNTDASPYPRDDIRSASRSLPREQPRWKYTGPWLAGMQDGEFEQFLSNLLVKRASDGTKGPTGRSRIDDWRAFLTQHFAEQRLSDKRAQAQEAGEALSEEDVAELRVLLRPDGEELRDIEKQLRDGFLTEGLSSELTSLICAFLDLPAVKPVETGVDDFSSSVMDPKLRGLVGSITDSSDAADSAPPSTHPSAGLSYLRTSAFMENHPIHGPQAHHSPVLARVLRPRTHAQGTEYQAKIGVGGVVTNDPVSSSLNPDRSGRTRNTGVYDADKMAHQLDPDLPGGNKMWVHPQSASIDEKGRIRLEVTRGDREAISVKNNDVQRIHEARAAASRGGPSTAMPGTGRSANYGFSLPGTRAPVHSNRAFSRVGRRSAEPARRSGVEGFDDSAAKSIRDLLEKANK